MAGGIAAFALWTLIYETGLGLQWPVTPLAIVWLVASPPIAFLVGRVTYREELLDDAGAASPGDLPSAANDPETATTRGSGRHQPARLWASARVWPAMLSAVGAAVLLSLGTGWLFWVGWVLAATALVWIAVDIRRRIGRSDRRDQNQAVVPHNRPSAGRSASWTAIAVLLTSLVAGVGSLFIYRVSADDAYYLNLSTWVAAHDHFPLRDTMFSDQLFPTSYGGGFPISSIEGLIGALAGLAHLRAPTMAYLILAPVLGFASIWVLGQLARLWTARRSIPVFAISALFVLIGRGSAYRAYSIFDIWEGKAAAIAILLPLIWVYATRIASSRRGHWIRMLALVGIAFIGLTSTAAILAPAIGGALLLAAALVRNRRIVAGAIALVVAPLLGGLAVAFLSQSVGGPHPKALTPWEEIHRAYGSSAALMVLLTTLSVLLAPFLLRGRWARALAWSAAAVPILLLVPGVLALGNLVTGAGPVEWRLMLVPPVPTLVGVLMVAMIESSRNLAIRHRSIRTATTVIMTAAAVIVLSFVDGSPPWRASLHLSHTPVWKATQPALNNVEALIATDPPAGQPILMPPKEMIVLSWYTAKWHGVAPRGLYVANLQEPARLKSARMTLMQLASAKHPSPPRSAVKQAVQRLDVGTVCLNRRNHSGQASVRAAGFTAFTRIGTLRCATRVRPNS